MKIDSCARDWTESLPTSTVVCTEYCALLCIWIFVVNSGHMNISYYTCMCVRDMSGGSGPVKRNYQ